MSRKPYMIIFVMPQSFLFDSNRSGYVLDPAPYDLGQEKLIERPMPTLFVPSAQERRSRHAPGAQGNLSHLMDQ